MPNFERITLIIESLPGARAQVQVDIPTPRPGMRLETAAHALAIDALGWLGKQPAVAGFVYCSHPTAPPEYLRRIANLEAALATEMRHHGIRNASAVRTLHALGYSWHGADAWQPPAQGMEAGPFEQRMSDWAHQDAQDAARWREAIKKIGAENQTGAARYVIRGLEAPVNVMCGSVAEHFTKSIDDVLAAHTKQEQAA